MTDKNERGTGRTTKQMKDAPQGAVFIWCNDHTMYPRQLAESLGRKDLQIFGINTLGEMSLIQGKTLTGLVVDHAIWWTFRLRENYEKLMLRVRL